MKLNWLIWLLVLFISGAVTAEAQQTAGGGTTQVQSNLSCNVRTFSVNKQVVPNWASKTENGVTSEIPLSINVRFGREMTAQQIAVINQAVSEWEAMIEVSFSQVSRPFTINFSFGTTSTSTTLAETEGFYVG